MYIYCYNIAENQTKNDLMKLLSSVKDHFDNSQHDSGRFQYNSLGAVYVADDDDFACGASLDYIQSKLDNADEYYIKELQTDPEVLIDILDQYEADYSSGVYSQEKYAILARFNMIHSKKSNDFYSTNWDILENVYSIACDGRDLEDTMTEWSDATPTLEIAMKKMVSLTSDSVIFKGIPYEGLAGFILNYYYGTPYMTKRDTDYDKKSQILNNVISKIQRYLQSEGISSEYHSRRRCLIADRSDFK